VVWATGYQPDYAWIHLPVSDGDGRLRHRRGVTDVPGLYFLGLAWQHTRGSALLGWVKDDAEFIAARIDAGARSQVAAAANRRQPDATHAPPLADMLARRPDLLDGLIDESSFALPPEPDAMAERLRSAMRGEPYDRALDRARRLIAERRFSLGVQLIAAHADPLDLAMGYSNVAEGTIVAMAELASEEFAKTHGKIEGGELMILALGRLGGRALTHASDLVIIYVYDAPEGAMSDGKKPLSATDYYNRLANRITAAISVPTAAGPLYEVDTRLRPQGGEGMLAVSLEGFLNYQRGEAWTWEHMALCRARPIFGSAERREKLTQAIRSILSEPRDSSKTRSDAAKMREESSFKLWSWRIRSRSMSGVRPKRSSTWSSIWRCWAVTQSRTWNRAGSRRSR
jgi:hypothetical protein